MQDTEFKLGDRVIVSAAVTGYGEEITRSAIKLHNLSDIVPGK